MITLRVFEPQTKHLHTECRVSLRNDKFDFEYDLDVNPEVTFYISSWLRRNCKNHAVVNTHTGGATINRVLFDDLDDAMLFYLRFQHGEELEIVGYTIPPPIPEPVFPVATYVWGKAASWQGGGYTDLSSIRTPVHTHMGFAMLMPGTYAPGQHWMTFSWVELTL